MSNLQNQLKSGVLAGIKKGWGTFIWICKIVIPVSFLVTLLQWSGWLDQLDFLLNPLMRLLNLPAEAALPIVTGMLINIYASIAIITVIPFTVEQMTLIAIFNLVAHSLIVEGIIQHKSGINILEATLFRIAVAILTVLIVSQFFGDTSESVVVPATLMARTSFLEVLKAWAIDMIYLLLKILGIIMAIMILQECVKALGWLDPMLRFFRPFMRILGLSERAVMLWLTAIIFGLLYGGAVIVEEAKRGALMKGELEYLHVSIGVNHSMMEDPLLFAVLGLNLCWLWIPRFIMAIIAVQSLRSIKLLRGKLIHY